MGAMWVPAFMSARILVGIHYLRMDNLFKDDMFLQMSVALWVLFFCGWLSSNWYPFSMDG